MRNFRGHLIAWTICIALALIAGEIAGAIVFYRQQNARLVYTNRPQGQPASAVEQAPTGQRLHPYLGFGGYYSTEPGSLLTWNNMGFGQNTPYRVPFKVGGNDLAVFVFGGSVAGNIVAPPQAGKSLERALKDKLPDRNVIVYAMAQGSAKQPQQAIALTMLLSMGQHVDVVVNLDGFNDVAIGNSNHESGVDPIFPSVAIMWGIGTTLAPDERGGEFYRTAADIIDSKYAVIRHTDAANAARFGLSYLYDKFWISHYTKKKAKAETRYQVLVVLSPTGHARVNRLLGIDMPVDPKADGVERSFDIWLDADKAMAGLSGSAGAKYVHVIQPNQYYSKKRFSDEEARIALSMPPDNSARVGAERGYALFEARADALKSRGIISGVSIFDDQTAAMYVDSCCHYTRAGEDILADFVADQVVKAITKP